MKSEFFPDGTRMEDWFYDLPETGKESLGKQYLITNYGIADDDKIYTEQFQSLIDQVSENGGGVIVIPQGTYRTGALYFKKGVNLYLEENGVLMGSDHLLDYPLCKTRIEGEVCTYFPALLNVDGVDGFKICGKGTIDGNGHRSWEAFWLRRRWNPKCTNKDEQRPRLLYVANSKNVLIADVKLQNSHFWTGHFYKCQFVKIIGCRFFSPVKPVSAPSTDALDIDVCEDVLVKNCYFHVNDDAIALKGGKGPDADILPENGGNERVLVEDCEYEFCHSCLTCGSESIHNRNIYVRNIKVSSAFHLLWLKMRPDTPQHYEYITIENATGKVNDFLNINPWKQFFDLKGRSECPMSYADHITVKDSDIECGKYLNIKPQEDQYRLSDFTFKNLTVKAKYFGCRDEAIKGLVNENVSCVTAE